MSDNSHRFGTVGFEPRKFDQLLTGEVAWRLIYLPATICPCRDRISGSPQARCPRCFGYGYSWRPPEREMVTESFYAGSERPLRLRYRHVKPEDLCVVYDRKRRYEARLEGAQVVFTECLDGALVKPPKGKEFRVRYHMPKTMLALVTALKGRREQQQQGVLEHRDLNLTIPTNTPAFDCGEFDRFVAVDAKIKVQQVLYRQGVKEHSDERLLYAYVYDVAECLTLSKDYAEARFVAGEDFTLTDGTVRWHEGKGPPPGRPYSLVYHAAPEFYVFSDLPQLRHQGAQDMPRRVGLRSWQLFPRHGALSR